MSRVDTLTDEQVVEEFSRNQFGEEMDQQVEDAKTLFLQQIRESGCFPEESEAELVAGYEQLVKSLQGELLGLAETLVRDGFTLGEMRAMLRFREQYPEIHTKQKALIVMLAQQQQPIMRGFLVSVDEFMEEAEEMYGM